MLLSPRKHAITNPTRSYRPIKSVFHLLFAQRDGHTGNILFAAGTWVYEPEYAADAHKLFVIIPAKMRELLSFFFCWMNWKTQNHFVSNRTLNFDCIKMKNLAKRTLARSQITQVFFYFIQILCHLFISSAQMIKQPDESKSNEFNRNERSSFVRSNDSTRWENSIFLLEWRRT